MGLMRKQDIFMVLKYHGTDCLLVAKGKIVTMQRRNQATPLIK